MVREGCFVASQKLVELVKVWQVADRLRDGRTKWTGVRAILAAPFFAHARPRTRPLDRVRGQLLALLGADHDQALAILRNAVLERVQDPRVVDLVSERLQLLQYKVDHHR